jgi:hypothetical protein
MRPSSPSCFVRGSIVSHRQVTRKVAEGEPLLVSVTVDQDGGCLLSIDQFGTEPTESMLRKGDSHVLMVAAYGKKTPPGDEPPVIHPDGCVESTLHSMPD